MTEQKSAPPTDQSVYTNITSQRTTNTSQSGNNNSFRIGWPRFRKKQPYYPTLQSTKLEWIWSWFVNPLYLLFLFLPRMLRFTRPLSFSLFVCLFIRWQLHIKLLIGLRENFISVDMEAQTEFWKSSDSGSGDRSFRRTLQHCEKGHFSTVWLFISLLKSIWSWRKFLSEKEVAIK